MTHPQGFKRLWRGVEVEGRFRGLETLFTGPEATFEDIVRHAGDVPHIFVNPSTVDALGLTSALTAAGSGGSMVTVCLTLDQYLEVKDHGMLDRKGLSVMLALDLEGPIDQVRLADPRGVRVASQWTTTTWDEYELDKELTS